MAKRSKWEAYTGVTQQKSFSILKEILMKEEIDYHIRHAPPNFMYDSVSEQIIIQTKTTQITLIQVTADPITRFILSLTGTREHLSTITLMSIEYEKDSLSKLRLLLQEFSDNIKSAPWKIRKNTRFQHAFLLEQINKLKWKRLIV